MGPAHLRLLGSSGLGVRGATGLDFWSEEFAGTSCVNISCARSIVRSYRACLRGSFVTPLGHG